MAEVEQYGPYTRVRRLGMGGMAETFLAVQRGAAGFEQRVCMKFILPGYRENADFRRLFLREASIAASLRHSNIVGVIDVDDEAGYMVLELVDGVDLRALLNEAPNHRLPGELATLITIELCKALAYAHGRNLRGQFDGIVHRDISPSNVLVSYAGEVKLTDFGVARAMRSDAEPLSTTVKGKLCYMSPEQARGLVLDGRSDLFSLGVVCYELLSGQRPFDGQSDADTLLRVTAGQHLPLIEVAPDVPGGLAMVVEKLLCRDREQRFVSADACIDALARFAPRVTSFRDLGDLARSARPHETIPSVAMGENTGRSKPKFSMVTETQGLPESRSRSGQRAAPVSRPYFDDDDEQEDKQASKLFGRSLRRVNRNAWSALAISLVLLLGVASAWTARLSSEAPRPPDRPTIAAPPPVDPKPAVITQPIPVEQPPTTLPPTVQAPPVYDPQNPPGGTVFPEHVASPPPVWRTRSQHGRQAGGDSTRGMASNSEQSRTGGSDQKGEVTIGVIPPGQVWIDGKAAGWAPVRTELKIGPHKVSAGNTRPEVHRVLRIHPGEQDFLFNLDNAPHNSSNRNDETTLDAPDR